DSLPDFPFMELAYLDKLRLHLIVRQDEILDLVRLRFPIRDDSRLSDPPVCAVGDQILQFFYSRSLALDTGAKFLKHLLLLDLGGVQIILRDRIRLNACRIMHLPEEVLQVVLQSLLPPRSGDFHTEENRRVAWASMTLFLPFLQNLH